METFVGNLKVMMKIMLKLNSEQKSPHVEIFLTDYGFHMHITYLFCRSE